MKRPHLAGDKEGHTVLLSQVRMQDARPSPWDYCLVFPLPEIGSKERAITQVMAATYLEQVFRGAKYDFLPTGRTLWGRVQSLGAIDYSEFLDLLRKTCVEVISVKCGLSTRQFTSRDKDEIYVKIVADENDLKLQADKQNYRMKLDASIDSKTTFAAHAPYDRDFNKVFQMYDSHHGKTMFRSLDRIRLVESILTSLINLQMLSHYKLCRGVFPLHDMDGLSSLRAQWGNLSLRTLFKRQPVDEIRNYFGEKIGLYYSWLGFYRRWLVLPSIIGFAFFIVQVLKTAHFKEMNFAFCIIIALWGTLFLEFWKRHQSELAIRWGMEEFEQEETIRPAFEGTPRISPVTDKPEKFYSPTKRRVKQVFSMTVALIMVGCVIGSVGGIMIYKNKDRTAADFATRQKIGALVNAIQIKVFNVIYGHLAVWLTNWENHQTDTAYEDSLIYKTFLFQFVNSYNSLLYIAFLKRLVEEQCQEGDCLMELTIQLGILFGISLALNLVEIILPSLSDWWSTRQEDKKIAKLQAAGMQVRTRMTQCEEQMKLAAYPGPYRDYLKLIVQFGYVTLFCAAFPLAPLLALIVNLLEIRFGALLLCKLTRRPFPYGAQDIGSWQMILEVMTVAGVMVNIGIAVRTSDTFAGASPLVQLAIFLCIEHLVLILKYVISSAIPDVPTVVKVAQARHKILVDRIFHQAAIVEKDDSEAAVAEAIDQTVYDDDF
eukprot:GILK01002156.1.p1 GENE.GILK01002156.1~~GILK01002156.1.p1  ORF type:complete len:714 (-),score=75.35 GILK01002156.1:101-2242(-)